MNYLLEEITREKMRRCTEIGYIQRLQQLSDKGRCIDLFHFIQTGRIYRVGDYIDKFNVDIESCHPDTKHVLVYVMGYKIDILENKKYHMKIESEEVLETSVKRLEKKLFEYFCNNSST